MADRKPLPFIVDGRAHYSLTSYDPVKIEVFVTSVTEEDIDYVVAQLLQSNGAGVDELDDPAFLSEHFDGITSKDQLRATIRKELEDANKSFAEDRKLSLAAQELAKRLVQAVPADQVLRVRQGIELQLRQEMAQQGASWEAFVKASGGQAKVDEMLDAQARETAEEDSALAAYAEKKKLKVQRAEIPGLLGVPAEHAAEFLDHVEAAGQMDDFVEGALRAKAVGQVVAEAECSYHQETPEEAADRRGQLRQMIDALEKASGKKLADHGDDGPHLKLV